MVTAAWFTGARGWSQSKPTRPNILFLMADDHTWQAVASYGSRLKEVCPTSNIDRIAQEGMMLKNCFCTNSICTPSRASILSGQYSHKNGVYTLADDWDPNHRPNLAIKMQEANYETAVIGKWHLHTEPQGFDYYHVLPGQGEYFDPKLKEKGKPWQDHDAGGQGMLLGEHDHVDKRWMFEESLRMPFLVRYPREIPANSVNDDIINNVDFAPTLLDYAGMKAPTAMQGRSFRAILGGHTPPDWRQVTYYRYWMHRAHHDVPAHYGIRTKRYKLIFFYGLAVHPKLNQKQSPGNAGQQDPKQLHQVSGWGDKLPDPTPAAYELYDLEKDPHELMNVYHDPTYSEVVKRLKQKLLQIKQELGDTDEQYPELMRRREQVN